MREHSANLLHCKNGAVSAIKGLMSYMVDDIKKTGDNVLDLALYHKGG
jgi:hypothetical protein